MPPPCVRLFCLLTGTLLTLTGCLHTEAPAPKSVVKQDEIAVEGKTFVVSLKTWPHIAKVQGSLFADEVATIAAKVPGRVVEVSCDLGDHVQNGQPLVKLDTSEYELLVAQAEAQLTQARSAIGLKPGDPIEQLNPLNSPPVREASAVLDESKQAVKRLEKLFTQGAVVATDLEVAQAAATVADARYNSSLNSVREKIALVGVQSAIRALAEERLQDTTISAPFSGMIQNRTVAVGSYVNVGQPIVELVRTSVLRYRAAVPERFASDLKIGQRVKVFLHDKGSRDVEVTRISPALDAVSRSLTFEAEVPNEDGSIRSGSFAQADIVLNEQSRTIAIPYSAVMRFAGVDKAWRVIDGKVSEAVVQIGREQDGFIEILKGLEEGDTLLLNGRSGRVGRFKPTDSDSEKVATPADGETTTDSESVPMPKRVPGTGGRSTIAVALESDTPPSPPAESASRTSNQSALGR